MTRDSRPMPLDRFRVGKTYTAAQAARLAGVTPGTIRNWMLGYAHAGYEMYPVLGQGRRRDGKIFTVSFLELAELIVVSRYRKWGIDLPEIRGAHAVLREEWRVSYPFATINMATAGGRLLARYQEDHPSAGQFVVLTKPEQYVLPGIVQEEVERLDFDKAPADPFAFRWHPFGRDLPVVVDPRFAGGKMTIEGRGVTVEALMRRHDAGEKFADIADDYDLKEPLVRAVLQRVA
jgi:uncharacterized protein (DUF433 family)